LKTIQITYQHLKRDNSCRNIKTWENNTKYIPTLKER
jgi:hypothetical protein